MDAHWIFERSELGQSEVEQRKLRLPLQVRAMLIMVDGRSNSEQLLRKAAGINGAAQLLSTLHSSGLIRRREDSSSMPAVGAPASPQITSIAQAHQAEAKPAGIKRRSLALARMYLMNIMERALGPSGEVARTLLRNATTREDLVQAFIACGEILEEMAGAERLEHIRREFNELLPSADTAANPYLTSSIQAA